MPHPATATPRPSPIIWRAGADEIAHAHRRGDLRTGCGERIVDERYARTSHGRCPRCLDAFGVTVPAPSLGLRP